MISEVDNLITQVVIFDQTSPLIDTVIGVAGRERDVEPLEQHEHVVPAADHGVQRRAQQAPVPPEQDHAGDLRPGEAH